MKITTEDHEVFRKYFGQNPNLEEDLDRSICPLIVGRPEAKLATALTLCSPAAFRFDGELLRGNLHTMSLGDTTTGKSKIMEWVRDTLGLGEYGTGDMSTYAGLLAAVDTEKDIIIWGLLPMADRELAMIDSFQKIHFEDLPMFREALREEKLVVRKKVSGEAACRARILAAANPRKPLDQYIDPAEALLDVQCMTDPVDLTRWDLFIKFYDKDVSGQEIANSHAAEPRIPVEVMRKFVLWAWSLRPEQISFTLEAERAVRASFLEFNELYCSDLPLVHKGYKEVIARLATAFAALHYSVTKVNRSAEESTTPSIGGGDVARSLVGPSADLLYCVNVTGEHVEEAVRFLKELVRTWEYEDFVARKLGERTLTGEDVRQIDQLLEEELTARQIFWEIVRQQGIEAGTLASKFDVTKAAISRNVAKLKELDLVESKERRKGYWLTPKGVGYVKALKSRGSTRDAPESRRQAVLEIIERTPEDIGTGNIKVEDVYVEAERRGLSRETVDFVLGKEAEFGHLIWNRETGWIRRTVR